MKKVVLVIILILIAYGHGRFTSGVKCDVQSSGGESAVYQCTCSGNLFNSFPTCIVQVTYGR